jgi:hypothetical protein
LEKETDKKETKEIIREMEKQRMRHLFQETVRWAHV